jgi:hypothetical protein
MNLPHCPAACGAGKTLTSKFFGVAAPGAVDRQPPKREQPFGNFRIDLAAPLPANGEGVRDREDCPYCRRATFLESADEAPYLL